MGSKDANIHTAAELPLVLTIDEAARLLRIGRAQTYALAHRYLDSGGATGIPVVVFGSSLRVPTAALLRLLDSGSTWRASKGVGGPREH